MITRSSVRVRILLVLVSALTLVGCDLYDPFSSSEPPSSHVDLALAARSYFCAQEVVTACDAQAGYWDNTGVMARTDLREGTGAEEVITLLTRAEQEMADQIAAASPARLTVSLSWEVDGLPLSMETQLGDGGHELARPALTLALTRAGTSAQSVTLSRHDVMVEYEAHSTVPQDLDLRIPQALQTPQTGGGDSGVMHYKQIFSSGRRDVELYLEPGQVIDPAPVNAILATDDHSKYGSRLQAYGRTDGLTNIHVCELTGDKDHRLTSEETTDIIRAVASCDGLGSLGLSTGSVSSRTSVATYTCTASGLAVTRQPNRRADPVLAQKLLDAARN